MINKEFARRIAAEHIEEGCKTLDGYTLVLLDDQTIERNFGWVFFYQSREFLDTGDYSLQLAGNCPLIVDRRDGAMHVAGTAQPIEYYIEEYERRRST